VISARPFLSSTLRQVLDDRTSLNGFAPNSFIFPSTCVRAFLPPPPPFLHLWRVMFQTLSDFFCYRFFWRSKIGFCVTPLHACSFLEKVLVSRVDVSFFVTTLDEIVFPLFSTVGPAGSRTHNQVCPCPDFAVRYCTPPRSTFSLTFDPARFPDAPLQTMNVPISCGFFPGWPLPTSHLPFNPPPFER